VTDRDPFDLAVPDPAGGPPLTVEDRLGQALTAARELRQKNVQLRAALEGLVDDEPCRLDNHGYCQTHGVTKPCVMQVARQALATAKE
jgi:hypothetical protein